VALPAPSPRWLVGCSALLFGAPLAWADPWPDIPVPPSNARSRTTPAPRPPPGDIAVRARHLLDALRADSPSSLEAASDFFLPREPFLAIKDMSGAAGYFAVLTRAYRRDIAAYRAQWPWTARAEFVRFELSTACTWMAVGHEANRLPYWSCYHSHLVARADGREHAIDVRVMIQWGDRWYVTHLGPRVP